ncbi:MAG: hypothetical protein JXN59_06945 [Anaerolineae bacterium]|nr:hypothetical protein [Anaerolineae bacterium]
MRELSQVNTILMVYTWFPLAALLAILLMIARFFQVQTQVRAAYGWFLLPIVLFGVAIAYQASIGKALAAPLADGLFLVGGLVLTWLCLGLYRRMTSGR